MFVRANTFAASTSAFKRSTNTLLAQQHARLLSTLSAATLDAKLIKNNYTLSLRALSRIVYRSDNGMNTNGLMMGYPTRWTGN
jgi:hypothetical protein